MAKPLSRFVCQNCGTIALRWVGKCEGCDHWNTFVEETVSKNNKKDPLKQEFAFVPLNGPLAETTDRLLTGCGEFDRVCGSGIVPGSVILVGGDPGIGKSTLLLQIAAGLSRHVPIAYISGEEGVDQIRLRARRLGIVDHTVQLAAGTQIGEMVSALDRDQPVSLVIIDSIQTMSVETIESAAGTVSQIRASTYELIRLAKKRHIAVILVGHVTKEGVIAGPRVLEHMVDTVLYFEGERGHPFRLLRGVKNRFGPTDEIGVFDMTDQGLQEVKNPSALFLSHRQEDVTGACVFAGIEGTRPLLVEIQGLVSPSFLSSPRRSVVGWDHNRLSMILAVLEARCGVAFSGKDVYLNVVGGLRIQEPAADLAVAAALLSCVKNKPIPREWVIFGEIGLSGEIRPVSQTEARLKEANKLGFSHALLPRPLKGKKIAGLSTEGEEGLVPHALPHVRHLAQWFSPEKKDKA